MRRIGDRIDPVGQPSVVSDHDGAQVPQVFRWRGRRYVVGSVLAHWVETGAWWRSSPPSQERPSKTQTLTDPERQMWRVEALRGASTGVFDL